MWWWRMRRRSSSRRRCEGGGRGEGGGGGGGDSGGVACKEERERGQSERESRLIGNVIKLNSHNIYQKVVQRFKRGLRKSCTSHREGDMCTHVTQGGFALLRASSGDTLLWTTLHQPASYRQGTDET